MPRSFPPAANSIFRGSLAALVILVSVTLGMAMTLQWTPYVTDQQVAIAQPVPFSHQHHVGGLGIDCRYCHTSAEDSSFAGIPPTKTCMTCHSQVWNSAGTLQPVRDSWQTNKPIQWNRVHNLPQYVLFPHDVHIAKGVGCLTCHGQVDQMPLTWQDKGLQMSWCLNCHRNPEQYLRPREQVFNMQYQVPTNQIDLGLQLKKQYEIKPRQTLESCSTCHY